MADPSQASLEEATLQYPGTDTVGLFVRSKPVGFIEGRSEGDLEGTAVASSSLVPVDALVLLSTQLVSFHKQVVFRLMHASLVVTFVQADESIPAVSSSLMVLRHDLVDSSQAHVGYCMHTPSTSHL